VVGLLVAAVFLDIMTRKYTWLAFAELSLLAAIVRREQEESSG
jgi:hypothetical protein